MFRKTLKKNDGISKLSNIKLGYELFELINIGTIQVLNKLTLLLSILICCDWDGYNFF
jgi:hypothetical protein